MSVFVLLERLAPLIESEVNLVINSKQEAASLSSKLSKIQVGLQEAERIGVTDKGVKGWLKELEDVTYEMADVLDELETANLQVQLEDKVRSLLLSLCLCFKQVLSRREITLKMKALSERIDVILTKKGESVFVSTENHPTREFKQEESTSLVKKIKFYGLDLVKDSLLKKLVSEGEGSDDDTQIISIVGIGGVGKTTLARVAYNDPEIEGVFAPKGWVSVSQSFDALDIARAILESFGKKSDDANRLDTLVRRINQAVNEKRFLLVLDNVWTVNRSTWEEIKDCLDGGKGSRIVVTTRHEYVATMMGTAQWQSLGLLSDSDCGTILNGVALEGRPREECEKLRDIGMDIAKKCNGLPLAARSVGSMLALGSFTEQEWRGVLGSPLWTNREEESDVFHLLNLSYTDLSPVLKRCFLSSVIFPKGTSLSVDEMSRVWMAYGYLNSNGSVDEVQLKGLQYFNDLAMRSFFQRFASDDMDERVRIWYKMHDIMHDFGSYLSGRDGYSFMRDGGLEKDKGSSSSPHNNLPWNSLGRLRTFSVRREDLRPDIFSHLTSVRVLSMSECNLKGVPEEVGKLIHLRYLNLSDNPITQLPETITDLCNLQTLDIQRCKRLSSLPEGMGKLVKLRHLVNSKTFELVEIPQGVEKLSGLWTLSEFRGRNLGCLRNLNQLQGSLSMFLEDLNVGDANLWKMQHLKKLELHFSVDVYLLAEVVEALKPPPNLQSLEIHCRWGSWLYRWIHAPFDNLKQLLVYGHLQCYYVPPLGKLPALEDLTIKACTFSHLYIEFLGLDQDASSSSSSGQVVGGFPRLKKLRFLYCNRWNEWDDIEEKAEEKWIPIMPLLEELELGGCSRLEALPHRLLGTATSLRVVKIFGGHQKLYQRYNNISGYDRHKIPHIPNQGWTVEAMDPID